MHFACIYQAIAHTVLSHGISTEGCTDRLPPQGRLPKLQVLLAFEAKLEAIEAIKAMKLKAIIAMKLKAMKLEAIKAMKLIIKLLKL